MAHHPDTNDNTSNNEHFQSVLEKALRSPSRRAVLRGGAGLVGLGALPMLNACGGDGGESAAPAGSASLGFTTVGKNTADAVQLPPGYTYKVVHATGDRLTSSIAAYSNLGTETDDWSQRIGDHHDGMHLFYVTNDGKVSATETSRAVLAVNHESSADAHFFHPRGQTSGGTDGKKFDQFGTWNLGARPALESLKEINHHGVSIAEVRRNPDNSWTYLADSIYNRRINAQTQVRFGGPAAQLANLREFMVTRYDPQGITGRGTLNNCGYGHTPWGTYLTCEENWATYFAMPKGSTAPDAKIVASRARYGVARAALADNALVGPSQGWHTVSADDSRFARWDVSVRGGSADQDFRNEPNTFGWIVEIDPVSNSAPIKRCAMGRFAHEAAVVGVPAEGKPLAFYQGCDSRNEYIYKFVSNANWDARDFGGGLTAGDKYLNEGKLYVAKFNSDGTGQWLLLDISVPAIAGYAPYTFANQADVLVNARHAADAVGATKMDRPEWGAVNPANGEIYFTLTNNSNTNRTPAKTDAANPRSYNDPDGKKGSGNPNGHIIRFKEGAAGSAATTFQWDIFLFGAEEDSVADVNLSKLTAANAFSSPDGLWFSKSTGICWIQTDDGAFTDETNCMLLAAIPGQVGDGTRVTVNNSLTVGEATTTGTQATFVGAALGEAKLRRFLVAPKGAEVTGLTESADGRSLFVCIQHPGENTVALGAAGDFTYESQWPGNAGAQAYGPAGRPRSATIVVTRIDGGKIGL